MLRYMPQDVFDLMVVFDLMTGVANQQNGDRILDGPIERYLRSYPSEERGQLSADIYTAAHLSAPTVDDIRKACGGTGDPKHHAYVFLVLERISKMIIKNNNAKKSVFRRIFGGTTFNYETQPQIDRARRSRANIATAALAVLTAELNGIHGTRRNFRPLVSLTHK